jgi:hypothetical protein
VGDAMSEREADPVVPHSGTNKSHGEGAVIEAARAIVGQMPQRPSPHGPRPAVMDESAPFAALWDAVQALDAPDGESGAGGEGTP